ncbi:MULTISPECIES: DUF3090 domain-containing protein [Gordonia]|uniref:DUF3090 domain-containing protein n=1 Tax=Gordonia cholesterolivorans TaxID=559625 RepID=A0ABN3HSW3_9ACTN|nr:DUF3090 domain-containing protein [Gordonia sihwensis]KJR06702.1 hypothetical protein UG54_13010 [Gordonia sihwensis]
MARTIHEFRSPRRFVAGTVGQPGDRTFYIQVSQDSRLMSVELEKQQVLILADRLSYLLDEVRRRFGTPIPPEAEDVGDVSPLESPIDSEFRVGSMGLGWDADAAAVVIELLAVTEQPLDESVILDDTEEGPDTVRVFLTADEAREFSARSMRVIAAGRPLCPLCNQPLDPSGHICARSNGYKRDAEFSRSLEFVDPEVLASLSRLVPGFDSSFTVEDEDAVLDDDTDDDSDDDGTDERGDGADDGDWGGDDTHR